MKTKVLKKIAVALVAVAASAGMTSCAGWWVGSDGWGLTQPGPGGINIGISGGWNAMNPNPGPPPGPPGPPPGAPVGPPSPPPMGGVPGPPPFGPF